MAEYVYPGVYVEEIDRGPHPISGVSTTVAAFVGFAPSGPLAPAAITSFLDYSQILGGFGPGKYLAYAVQGFFQNGGVRCYILRLPPEVQGDGKGVNRFPAGTSAASLLRSLDAFSDVSIVCCPDEHSVAGMTAALIAHCEEMRYRIAVLSAPQGSDLEDAPVADARSAFAAYYAPWVMVPNPDGGADLRVHPGGHIAGAIIRNDLERGVAYAPANLQVLGITALERQFTKQQQEMLNQRGVNLLRSFPGPGNLIWGARTTSQDPEWKYVNIRRYSIYLEQSIDQGLQWVVFEPNGEQLWAQVQQTIGNFLFNEWKSGALLGIKADQAYFVRCDATTMTQDDIENGRLVCLVGVALLFPAEFIVFRIGQWTADATS